LYLTNVPRNVATSSSQSHRQYYLYLWSGEVNDVVTSQNISFVTTRQLSFGHYKLRFSALKHFGNFTDNDDFDIYYTPSFNLVY
jgi:hypothetical protein